MYGFIQGMWNCISKFYSWISPLIAWLCAQITYHSTISNIFQMNWANSYMFPVPHPMWSHTYIHCIEPSIHVMDSYLLVWIISMPASNSRMLVAVQKIVAFAKLQWKTVGMDPLAEKSCKLLSKTLRMYEPLRFSLSVWPPGSTRIWNSSIYKQKSRFTYTWNCSQVYIKRRKFTDTIRMLAIYTWLHATYVQTTLGSGMPRIRTVMFFTHFWRSSAVFAAKSWLPLVLMILNWYSLWILALLFASTCWTCRMFLNSRKNWGWKPVTNSAWLL